MRYGLNAPYTFRSPLRNVRDRRPVAVSGSGPFNFRFLGNPALAGKELELPVGASELQSSIMVAIYHVRLVFIRSREGDDSIAETTTS